MIFVFFCIIRTKPVQTADKTPFLTKGSKSFIPRRIYPRVPLSALIILTFGPPFTMATSMDTLPAHLLPLVMEEFPQSLATACVCRAGQREPRLRCVQCGIIEEEEEDCSTLEEDQAQRSFLQTVESLRRSTRWACPDFEHDWDMFDESGFPTTSLETNRCRQYYVISADCTDCLWWYFDKAVSACGHHIWQWMSSDWDKTLKCFRELVKTCWQTNHFLHYCLLFQGKWVLLYCNFLAWLTLAHYYFNDCFLSMFIPLWFWKSHIKLVVFVSICLSVIRVKIC